LKIEDDAEAVPVPIFEGGGEDVEEEEEEPPLKVVNKFECLGEIFEYSYLEDGEDDGAFIKLVRIGWLINGE